MSAIASGCSAVRLAHLLWEQGVAGSNPATPTNNKRSFRICGTAFLHVRQELNLFGRLDDMQKGWP